MKRLSVLSILVIGAVLLAACISTGQATINPNPTAVQNLVSTAGAGLATLAPEVLGTGTGGQSLFVTQSAGPGGMSDTVVPNTGLSSVLGTPAPLGDAGLEGTTMPTYSPEELGTMAAFQTPAGVPDTGATALSQEGTSYPGGYGPSEMATGQAFLPPGSQTQPPSVGAMSTPVPTSGTGVSVPSTGGQAQPTSSVIGTQLPSTGATGQANQFARLQSLTNYSLQDSTGNILSTVSDFIINLQASRVDYLVVNAGIDQVLVPWSAISSINNNGQAFVFNSSAAKLQGAPPYTSNGADFNQPNWDAAEQSYWFSSGAAASGTSVPPATSNPSGAVNNGSYAMPFSQLVNIQVVTSLTGANQSGGNTSVILGSVRDAIVNPVSGALQYLLVSANTDFMGLNNRLIPVPFFAFQRTFNGSTMYFAIDVNALRNAPNFDASNLPNILGQGWDSSIFNYWTGGLFRSGTATP